jgi:UDP-N-acetylmuramoyl-tripeptide--D-alanyl-D-alanine ligase
VRAALDFISGLKSEGRRVAVLGTINELGGYSKDIHRNVAEYAKGKVDQIIFVGSYASLMKEAYGKESDAITFSDRNEMLKNITKVTKPGDVVLFKASQNNNYFEEGVKLLMKDKNLAGTLLVRQSSAWLRRKK